MPGQVIPSRAYVQAGTGRTASIYGSLPTGDGWTIQTTGWTVKHPDGTIGLARKPFETEAEAQAWVDAHPNFPGMNQG